MKTYFQAQNTQKTAQNLIVCFSGWGITPHAFSHIQLPDDSDLLICYDHQNLDLHFDFSPYTSIRLVAFSLGVWVAEQVMQGIHLQSATAMNGTTLPYHDDFGIPTAIFQGTLDGLKEQTRHQFERRMCGNIQEYTAYQQLPDRQSLEGIHSSLAFLLNAIKIKQNLPQLSWQKAIISEQDRIFLAEKQLNFWQQNAPRVQIKTIKGSHYLLPQIKHWEELWAA